MNEEKKREEGKRTKRIRTRRKRISPIEVGGGVEPFGEKTRITSFEERRVLFH